MSTGCVVVAVLISCLVSYALETVMNRKLLKTLPNSSNNNFVLTLGSMFHVLWMGDAVEPSVDYLLSAVFFGCIFCAHLYCLDLYRRIAVKTAADKRGPGRRPAVVSAGQRTPAAAGDFSNILNPSTSIGNPWG